MRYMVLVLLVAAVAVIGCEPAGDEIKDPVMRDCVKTANKLKYEFGDMRNTGDFVKFCWYAKQKQIYVEDADRRVVKALEERDRCEASLDKMEADAEVAERYTETIRGTCISYCGEIFDSTESQCEWNCGN